MNPHKRFWRPSCYHYIIRLCWCPRPDSNRHDTDFKSGGSANWPTWAFKKIGAGSRILYLRSPGRKVHAVHRTPVIRAGPFECSGIPSWCPIRDSNPKNPDFESGTYANSINRTFQPKINITRKSLINPGSWCPRGESNPEKTQILSLAHMPNSATRAYVFPKWCFRRDSNSEPDGPEPPASANCATEAFIIKVEQDTGLEPATFAMARRRSTN